MRTVSAHVKKARESIVLRAAARAWSYGVPWAEAFEVASAADRAAGAAMPPPLRKGKGGKGKGKKGVGRGKGRG